MSLNHDELVDLLSHIILQSYPDLFGEVFIANVSMDFPKPDFIYVPIKMRVKDIKIAIREYPSIKRSLSLPVAFEVKTPFVYKHEYITGIGQAISYNASFPLSYLVIPAFNFEGFNVSSFVKNIVKTNSLNIGIISYKPNDPYNVQLEKEAQPIIPSPEKLSESVKEIKKIKRSYSYWRETKPDEVFEALRISHELRDKSEPNIMNSVLEKLWSEVLSKRFPRTKRRSSFFLNYKLFLIQNAFLDANGRLTIIGKHVYNLGERFGKDSELFKEIVTYVMLKYGGHYILLSKIYKEQMNISPLTWEEWATTIQERLAQQNYYISKDDFRVDLPRMPYAYEKYFCGIVRKDFIEGKGILIDYPKIMEILEKGRQLFYPVEITPYL